jgi:hypothetical protein
VSDEREREREGGRRREGERERERERDRQRERAMWAALTGWCVSVAGHNHAEHTKKKLESLKSKHVPWHRKTFVEARTRTLRMRQQSSQVSRGC